MATTTTIASLDLQRLSELLREAAAARSPSSPAKVSVRSTVFSLGSSAQAGSLHISTPNLFLVELLKDQLKQLFVRINWKIPRFDIDSGKTIGFNVYRKKIRSTRTNKLSQNQFSKLTTNLKRNGKFSEDRKGIFNVRRGLIDQLDLNPNIDPRQNISSINSPPNEFEKIAFIDFSDFLRKQKEKQVFVQDDNDISFFYDDKTVGFGEEFEFYVSAVSSNFDETFQSDVVRVLIIDNSSISAPSVALKQLDFEFHNVLVNVSYKREDQIDNVFIFRLEKEFDIEFVKIAEFFDVSKDLVEFVDEKILPGKQYTYRVFLENIHGVLSPATEITFSSLANVEKSQSNKLRKPIFHAIQQKNIATLTISPNDNKVLFFRVDRRDLSIYEKLFTVPSRDTDGYGGNGWKNNQLFYDRQKMSPITFVDQTVAAGHIYQYRLIGFDRFGNQTSCSYQTIEILEGNLLKAPINLQIFSLREFPLRIKLKWTDENVYEDGVTPLYEVQRRASHGEFASFPFTENNFLIDEVFSDDVVNFLKDKTDDVFNTFLPSQVRVSTDEVDDSKPSLISVGTDSLDSPLGFDSPPSTSAVNSSIGVVKPTPTLRSRGVLDFLKENFFYFYKVKVVTPLGEISPFSEQINLTTFQPLSKPINFSVVNENVKLKPAVVILSWETEGDNKMKPDHFVIERKIDSANDSFVPIGKAYFENQFSDRQAKFGKSYIYRIKSVDLLGRETEYTEVRISI